MSAVFISYRSADAQGFAGRLADDLSERFGDDRVFRDDELVPGHPYPAAIHSRLYACDALLAVIGPSWLELENADGERRLNDPDDWVRREIVAALARGKYVVPVLVGGADMPGVDALPAALEALSRRQAISLRDDAWTDDVARLCDLLVQHLPSLARAEPSSAPSEPARGRDDGGIRRMLLVALGRGLKSLFGFAVLALIGVFLLSEYGGAEGQRFLAKLKRFVGGLLDQLALPW